MQPARYTRAMMDSPETGTGTRGDVVRRHNLGLVLRRVHLQPSSRSELTRESGLNRSTIGALVSELVERGLVAEAEPNALGLVGRPSPVVRPSGRPVALAVNPEIDAVTVAAVGLGGRVLERERVEVAQPPTPERAAQVAAEAIRRIGTRLPVSARIVGIGAAIPGVVRAADGLVRHAPHLAWRDAPFAELLSTATGLSVAAANDASLGARSEWTFGAGRGVGDLIYVNGGASGIGGGIVSGGVLLGGAAGHAGEIGHAVVRRGGSRDTTGARGTLESEVTRAALLAVLGLDSADPEMLERALLADRSTPVRAEVARQIDVLAAALGTAVNMLNPSRIVLGGFLAALAAVDQTRIERRLEEHVLPALGEHMTLHRAALGSDLLLIGAAELPFEQLFADPTAAWSTNTTPTHNPRSEPQQDH
jgi:predicted NBD/HSP70 family sugar kinase